MRPLPRQYGTSTTALTRICANSSRASNARANCCAYPGADWNLEMGTLAEAVNERSNAPAVLFERIPGYLA